MKTKKLLIQYQQKEIAELKARINALDTALTKENPSFNNITIGDKYKDGIVVSITANELLICKPKDEPEGMSWYEAMNINDRWRLPTKYELNEMYLNKNKIGGFSSSNYWSSNEATNNFAWFQKFSNGNQNYSNKSYPLRVRCVRSIKI